MNTYSVEDFVILSDMMSMKYSDYFHATCSHPNILPPVVKPFQAEDLLYGSFSAESIINKFIDFSCGKASMKNFLSDDIINGHKVILRKLILEEPLNQVPRYINKPDDLNVIAQWRLRIGK